MPIITKKIEPTYISLAVGYAIANFALLNYTHNIGGWNWIGKSCALAFSLMIIMALPKLRAELGFTLSQRSNSIKKSFSAITLLFVSAVCLSFNQENISFNIETLLFQLTMPSLDEELAYRGILLFLLLKGLHINSNTLFNPATILITLLFGTVHGIHYSNDILNIDPLAFLITTAIGSVLMYIRLLSGSVVFPIIGHSVFNVTLLSSAMIQYHG
jgi:membrane protease YdiL (CAAX protease family)